MSNEMSDNQQNKTDEVYCSSCGASIKNEEPTSQKSGVKRNKIIKTMLNISSFASLVLGTVGLFFVGSLIFTEILGLIFGIIGLKSDKREIAIVGIILSTIQFILIIAGFIFVFTEKPVSF